MQICGFLDLPAGDLRQAGFAVQPLWENSPLFRAVRDPDGYRGRCGKCDFRRSAVAAGPGRSRLPAITLPRNPFAPMSRPTMQDRNGSMVDIVNSRAAFFDATKVITGGVNSPVRAFKAVGGTPLFIASGRGSRVSTSTATGPRLCRLLGLLILGHAHPEVVEALQDSAGRGTSFGAPTLIETRLAQAVTELVPSVQLIRFVNSGTEATMSAVRLARGYTGRPCIVKFEGCYHGHGDSFLIAAGSGAATLGIPDSAGVTAATAADTLVARYNDLDSVFSLFEKHGEKIAAIIVEPVAGNMGVVAPAAGFLQGLRSMAPGMKAFSSSMRS